MADIGRVHEDNPDFVLWPAHRATPSPRDIANVGCYNGGSGARVIAVWTDEEGTWVEFESTLPALTCFNCANEYSDWAWIERDEAGDRHVYECGWCDAQVYIPDDPDDERYPSGRWTRTLADGGVAHPKSPT